MKIKSFAAVFGILCVAVFLTGASSCEEFLEDPEKAMMEETDKIIKAQTARGADFDSGNLIRRAKAMVPILIPLFISAFRRADELATAMECRCYRGGENRTRLNQLKFTNADTKGWFAFAVLAAAVISINLIF